MKIISLVVGLTVGVLLMVGLVSPVVADGQQTAGDKVTFDNSTGDGNYYMRELEDGDVLEVILTENSNTTVKVNDVLIKTINGNDIGPYHNVLMSDVLTVWTTGVTSACQFGGSAYTTVGYTNATCTVTYSDGSFNVVYGTTDLDIPGTATWGYIVCNESEAGYLESTRTGQYEFYLSNDKDVVCSGAYTTGDNDTYYWYYDGVAHVSEDYTCSFTTNKVLVDGTTDVYKGTANFTVGDETFTPYRVLMPLEVTGYATSGANYALLGAIPIVAFIALIAFAVFAVRGRMND